MNATQKEAKAARAALTRARRVMRETAAGTDASADAVWAMRRALNRAGDKIAALEAGELRDNLEAQRAELEQDFEGALESARANRRAERDAETTCVRAEVSTERRGRGGYEKELELASTLSRR